MWFGTIKEFRWALTGPSPEFHYKPPHGYLPVRAELPRIVTTVGSTQRNRGKSWQTPSTAGRRRHALCGVLKQRGATPTSFLFNSFENIRCSLQRKGGVLYWGAIFVRQLKNARPVGKLGTAVLCGRCVEGSGRLVDVVVFAMVSVAVVVARVVR